MVEAETLSTINSKTSNEWKCSVELLPENTDIEFAKFFSQNIGFSLSSDGHLYRFSGCRDCLKSFDINIPSNGYVSGHYFESMNTGWITVYRDRIDSPTDFGSLLFITQDGGKTWSEQLRATGAEFSSVRFLDKDDGWIVGRTSGDKNSLITRPLLLHTLDGGRSWKNIPDKSKLEGAVGFDGIIPIGPGEAILLTSAKQFYQITESATFAELVTTLEEREQTYIAQMGRLDNGNMWVVGGADGREGVWGLLATYDGTRWQKFSIPNVYLKSAVFVSNKEVLVSGYERLVNSAGVKLENRRSLLLFSHDSGKSFEPICDQKKLPDFRSLDLVSGNTVIAARGRVIVTLKRLSR